MYVLSLSKLNLKKIVFCVISHKSWHTVHARLDFVTHSAWYCRQMVSNLPWMFRPLTMASSKWRVSSGGQTITRSQASSSARLVDVILSMMPSLLPQLTVSLLFPGLVIPSLMLSSISELIVLEILCTLSRQETVTLSNPSLGILPSYLHTSVFSSHDTHHKTMSGLKVVVTMSGKTSFFLKSTLSFLPSRYQCRRSMSSAQRWTLLWF